MLPYKIFQNNSLTVNINLILRNYIKKKIGPFFITKIYYLYWLNKAGLPKPLLNLLHSPKSAKTIPVNGPFVPLSNKV